MARAHARRLGQGLQKYIVALDLAEAGADEVRQRTRAPEPQRIDRWFALRHPLRIPGVVVQQHLGLAEQGPPAAAGIAVRQVREQIVAQHIVHRRELGQLRFQRQAQIPARRVRCIQRHAGVAEQGLERRQQVRRVLRRQAQRFAVGEHARTGHVR